MTSFRNTTKGVRGILLTNASYVFVQPGATATVPGHKIKGVPHGLIEIEADEIDAGDAEPLPPAPEPTTDDTQELEPVEGIAAFVLVSIGADDEFIVTAPWLDEPETYTDSALAEGRQAELREVGPPEGWEVPEEIAAQLAANESGDGAPGAAPAPEPVALSSMTKAELIAQAEKEGVDLSTIKGTGSNGNIIAADYRAAIEAKRAAA